jgi:hypothetical protein
VTFLHTRDGLALVTTCRLCGMSTRSLSESAIYLSQRDHDWLTCQLMRLAAARAVEEPSPIHRCPKGHNRAGNTHIDKRSGSLVCNACRRDVYAAQKNSDGSCVSQAMATGLGVSLGTIEASGAAPDLTPKPLLNTPSRRSIHMQNRSASATPRQNSRGVA